MQMKDRCFICKKDLSGINSILDAKYIKYSWRPHFDENKYIVFFSQDKSCSCVPCGKQLFMWNLSKNKINMVHNRTIKGDPFRLTKLPCAQLEHCVMCKQETVYLDSDPIHLRQYYLKSIGQCCTNCWAAIHNTATTGDDSFEDEIYY